MDICELTRHRTFKTEPLVDEDGEQGYNPRMGLQTLSAGTLILETQMSGELSNAANLTDDRQTVSLVSWLCQL
jgi:hypothetical protein